MMIEQNDHLRMPVYGDFELTITDRKLSEMEQAPNPALAYESYFLDILNRYAFARWELLYEAGTPDITICVWQLIPTIMKKVDFVFVFRKLVQPDADPQTIHLSWDDAARILGPRLERLDEGWDQYFFPAIDFTYLDDLYLYQELVACGLERDKFSEAIEERERKRGEQNK